MSVAQQVSKPLGHWVSMSVGHQVSRSVCHCDPFANAYDEEISVQEELLELQSNKELKPRLSHGYQQFWLQKEVPVLYPAVWGM
ncbi:hypothetical protein M514_14774 [Trichuris suis]|uniref:Uncharacterized protein n=1 Tax=Trichuris suis TaxID=68888 RepID=A0A085NTS4_9BILA|nr:hypothetical protein M514_14774 [Trichuris suis]